MCKKILLAFSFVILCQTGFALTCPSIEDIQQNALKGWKIYDSDEGAPLSPQREAEFKKSAERFALAEWTNQGKKRGMIHCFYRDKNGSDLEAYLEKENFIPENSRNYWYEVSGSMHCAAGADRCVFQTKTSDPQFATNSIFP